MELDEEKAKRIESASKTAVATGADLAAIKKNIEVEYKQREEKLLGKSKKKLGNDDFSSSESEPEVKKAPLHSAADKDGLVEFGLYPQTHVSDPNLIKSLNAISKPESNGWYLFDGKYYAKTSTNPRYKNYRYKDRMLVEKGSIDWFLCEPIKWRVLKKGGGEAYLLSDLLLDAHRFDLHSNDFDKSEIKSWLNGEFMKRAFSGNEDQLVGEISFLSKEDMENAAFGFSSVESRKAELTDWALANGAFKKGGFGWYWTKSPSLEHSGFAMDVYFGGEFGGNPVDLGTGHGVRPFIRVSIKEDTVDSIETKAKVMPRNPEAMPIPQNLRFEGGFAYFGLYPQTHVSDPNLIKSLNAIAEPESNEWYLFDGKYYAKVTAKPYHSDYEFEDGSKIAEGSEEWFLCEPIKWRVLEKGGGEAYLLSDLLLDAHRFDRRSKDFDKSEIKSWLNSEFKEHAFSGCAESMIGGLSLPSKEDVENASFGFANRESRKAKPTDWVLASGAYQYYGYGLYWTRSPYSGGSGDAWGVNCDGYVNYYYVNYGYYGVRPVIRVKIAE